MSALARACRVVSNGVAAPPAATLTRVVSRWRETPASTRAASRRPERSRRRADATSSRSARVNACRLTSPRGLAPTREAWRRRHAPAMTQAAPRHRERLRRRADATSSRSARVSAGRLTSPRGLRSRGRPGADAPRTYYMCIVHLFKYQWNCPAMLYISEESANWRVLELGLRPAVHAVFGC